MEQWPKEISAEFLLLTNSCVLELPDNVHWLTFLVQGLQYPGIVDLLEDLLLLLLDILLQTDGDLCLLGLGDKRTPLIEQAAYLSFLLVLHNFLLRYLIGPPVVEFHPNIVDGVNLDTDLIMAGLRGGSTVDHHRPQVVQLRVVVFGLFYALLLELGYFILGFRGLLVDLLQLCLQEFLCAVFTLLAKRVLNARDVNVCEFLLLKVG